ncbi:hypothetical protein A3770_19p83110 [Chloropicon primus]|uniref:Ig-like domain-containing protein n=2 Tax=Chloropicon primus TaxID=1764295 RepID=A0A5B8MYZ4_9CHLO|nr:hypothetical protein A3770_19p83110 [Chloropicon primus]|eukprot:QDZ25793.1 hypothetical protein A3770_19p83110 [Chloropicon primus]
MMKASAVLALLLFVVSTIQATAFAHVNGVYVYNVSPQSGPTSGGTKVTLTVKGGALPETDQYYFCKFGDQPVIAEHYTIDGGVGTFVCITPETATTKQVDVTFSIDGVAYTKPAKKQFAFHKPLVMENISPSVGSIGGGTSVLVSLDGEVVSRKTDGGILKPTCNFAGMKSRGTLISSPEGSSISCTVPSIYTLGHTDLSVSLNGVDYSENTGNFTIVLTEEYNDVVTKVTTHAMAGDPVFHVNGTSETGEFYGFFDMKFYDFYGFYGPSKDVAYMERTSEVCMVAVSPSVGPSSGGTVVTVKLAGVIPEGQETFFCKFGEKVVLADSFYYTEELSPAIVCTAPDFGSGSAAVELKISFDGITYTKSGSAFYYHDDIKIDNILPSMGTHMGGTTVGVRLGKSPMPSSFEVGLTTVPALCKFDTMEVQGQYVVTNDGPAVVCKTPGADLGVVNVKIALDGQHYSSDSVAFTFSLDPDEINPDHRMEVSRYLVEVEGEMTAFKNESFYSYDSEMGVGAGATEEARRELSFYEFYAFYDLGAVPFEGQKYKAGEIQKVFDYLPFSPDYCLFFNVGPDTSLEKLEIEGGSLFPAFDPQTFVYVTSVVKEQTCMNVTAFPTDKNVRSVTVGGHKIALDSTSHCLPLAVGENLVDVVVTGQDGQTTRTYSIVAVRLQGTKSGLEDLVVMDTTTNTPMDTSFFNTSILNYVVNVGIDVKEVILTPVPQDVDALVTVVVNGQVTYFGNQAVKTPLSAGSNLFEVTVEAEDGVKKTVYTFDLQREGTDLLSMQIFSDAAGTTPIPVSPGFNPATTVYTAQAGPIDVKFFIKLGLAPSATAEIAYDIGATSFSCAGGNQEGVTKNIKNLDQIEFCNPPGTNTMTITVKYQSLSTTYTVSVKRTSAAAQLQTVVNAAGNFYPPFDPNVYSYELVVKHTTSAFTLTPTVAPGAKTTMTVSYGGSSFSLSSGTATSTIATDACGLNDVVKIVVTAEDGVSTVTYTIQTVKLAEGIHSQLANFLMVNTTAGAVVPVFQPSTGTYLVDVLRSHKNGNDLSVGTDPVEVTFTWNAPQTYTSYGNFKGFTKKITLGNTVVDFADSNTVITPFSASVIHDDATGALTAASLTKSYAIVKGQRNEVEMLVESCDGRTNTTYSFDIFRGMGSVADMCNLVPSAGAFDTAFDKADTLYKINVAGDASSVGFTPTKCDSFAKIEAGACASSNRVPWTSGQLYTKALSTDFTQEQISTAEFCVTSENGLVKKTYSVTITRPLSSEALLKSLSVSLVKWDGSETTTAYTSTPTPIAKTAAISGTFEDAYFHVKATATIATAVLTMEYAGVTYNLVGGANSAVVPGAAGCVAPSLYYCDDGINTMCPEMNFGANVVTVKVTSQDGVNSASYVLTLTRPAITYASAIDNVFLMGHPILGLTELTAASGLTESTITTNFAAIGLQTAAVSKYGAFVSQEQIYTALAGLSQLPAAPTNADARFRAVASPRVQFLNDIADKMVAANTLVDRVSSGYTFGAASTTTLGTTAADSSPRVYVQPLFKNPYQSIKVEGVSVSPGCGLSLEADFGANDYKVEVFDASLTELSQYNVTVNRPYLPEALLQSYVSTIALDQTFVDTTFTYSTTVADTEDEVTLSFNKYDATSSVKAMLYYDGVLQSTVLATSATKFALSPFGQTTVVALVQTADGTDGGMYSFAFNKFPTILKSLTATLADATPVAFTPAFVDPSTTAVQTVQTSYVVSELTVASILVSATPLDAAATVAVKVGTTALTAVNGAYTVDLAADEVVVTVTVTGSDGVAVRVYTLTVTKELKNAAAAQSYVAFTEKGLSTTFGAGTAYIPVRGKTAGGKDALTGNFTCKVTGDATTFDQTFNSVFMSAGNFEVPLKTATIAGTYSYTCSLGGVAIGQSTGKITIIGGTLGSKSILSLVSTQAVRGSVVEFKIRTKDDYGNNVDTVVQSTQFTVTVTQVDGGVAMATAFNTTQTAGGAINWHFTPTLAYSGMYKVTITVLVGGLDTEIIGSGFLLGTTIPVTAASGWQVVYSPAYLAGGGQNVVVQPKAGVVAVKEQVILASMTGVTRNNAAFTKTFSCAGRATVQCTIPLGLTVTGNYTLTVKIGEALVGDQTYGIKVTGGAPDLTKTLLVFPTTANAGTPFDVKMSLVDLYDNPAASSLIDATQISVAFTQGASTVVPTAVASSCYFYNCEYVVTSKLTVFGPWKAQASYTGSPVGVSKTINVVAGAAVASKTSVTILQPTLTAGLPLALTAVPKDGFGNTIKVTDLPAEDQVFEAVILSDVLAKTTTFAVSGDVFTANLVITKIGTFNVIFKLGGSTAFQYAIAVTVGAVDPTKTKVAPPTTSVAGVETGFTVSFADAFENAIVPDLSVISFAGSTITKRAVAGEGTVSSPFVPAVATTTSGAYMKFVPFVSGSYQLNLQVDGVAVPNTDFMTVQPGSPSADLSVVSGNVLGATAGVAETAFVTVLDSFSNTHVTGLLDVQALIQLTPASGVPTVIPATSAWDAATKSYKVSYTANAIGSLLVSVSVEGVFLKKGLTTVVTPGPISALTSAVSGDIVIVKGQTGTLKVSAKDAFGNVLTTGGAPLAAQKVMATGDPADHLAAVFVTDNLDGTYSIPYTFAQAGTGKVKISLVDLATGTETELTESPSIEIKASSGVFSLTGSTLVAGATASTTADKTGSVVVTARDDQGVAMGAGGLQWSMQAVDSITSVALPKSAFTYSFVDAGTGEYTFTFAINEAGTYTVTVANTPTFDTTFTAEQVLGTFSSTITAGAAFAQNTLFDAAGSGYTGPVVLDAGVSATFHFDLYDQNNNKLGLAATEQALAGITANFMQAGVKTPLAVSFVTGVGAVATGHSTFAVVGDVHVSVNDVSKSIVAFDVNPGAVSTMLVFDTSPVKTAGQVYDYEVTLFDIHQNVISGGLNGEITGCTVTATSGATVVPMTCDFGASTTMDSLKVSTPAPAGLTKAGNYVVSYSFVQKGQSTPATQTSAMTITPAEASSTTSVLDGVLEKKITAGQQSFYTLTLSDAFGNFLNETTGTSEAVTVDSTITVGLSVGSVTTILTPILISPGVYQIPFGNAESLIAEPTAVTITVALNQVPLAGSPFTVPIENILPAATSTEASIVRNGAQNVMACAAGTAEASCAPHMSVVAGTTGSVQLFAYNTLGIPQVFKQEVVGASARIVAKAGQTVDAGDTGLTSEPTVTYQTGKGIYDVSFSANQFMDAGEEILYAVDMIMDAGNGFKPVFTVYFTVQPTSALPAATKIVATLSKISDYTALTSRYLFAHNQINTNDKYGNQAIYDPANPILITATAVGPAASAIYIEPLLNAAGAMSGQYILGVGTATAGTYFITISINGVDLESYSVTIEAGALDPASLSLTSTNSVAGVANTGKITGMDAFGNQLGTAALTAALTDATVTYTMALLGADGIPYTSAQMATFLVGAVTKPTAIDFSYTPKLAGSLEITATVTLGATTVMSFKKFTVAAGEVDVASSVVAGPALAGFVEDKATYFTVTLKDSLGNVKTGDCAKVTATISDATTLQSFTGMTVTEAVGSCVVAFTLPSGTYNMAALYNGATIKSFSSAAVVVVGDPDLASTLVAGLGYGDITVEAGSEQTFTVSLVAANGLLVPESQGATYVQATIVDAGGAPAGAAAVTDKLNGEYTVAYTINGSGTYKLSLLVGGALFSTQKSVLVKSTVTAAQNVTATVPAVATAGDVKIDVAVLDKFGNKQTYELYEVDDMQISVKEVFLAVPITDVVNGAGQAEVTLTKAGFYTVEFFFGTTLVSSNKIQVVAGEASVPNSVVYGEGLSAAKAGVESTFFIEIADEFQNTITDLTIANDFVNDATATMIKVGNATTTVPVDLEMSLVQGAVKATYTITGTGDYYLSIVVVDESTEPATSTTYTSFAGYVSTTVSAGVATANTITVGQLPTTGVFAGDVSFQILLEDQYGNPITTDQLLNFFIVARGTGSNLGEVTIAAPGTVVWAGDKYVVNMPITASGTYNLEVSRGADAIKGSPYALTVNPAPVDPAATLVEGGVLSGLADFTAGDAVSIKATPRDQFNNTVPLGAGETITAEYRYGTGEIVKVNGVAQTDNSVLFSGYSVTKAAEGVEVVVLFSDGVETTAAAQVSITVAPGPLDAAKTDVQLSGTTGANLTIAGQTVSVLVYPADVHGNPIAVTDATAFASTLAPSDVSVTATVTETPFAVSTSGVVLSKTLTSTVAADYVGDVTYKASATATPVSLIAGGLKLTVEAGDAVMSKTTVSGPVAMTAGAPASFSMTFFDTHGNQVSKAQPFMDAATLALPVKVGVNSFNANVLSRSFNGVTKKYVVTGETTKAGVLTFQFSVDGALVYETDALSPGSSEVFFIEPRDSFSNVLTSVTGAFTVTSIDSIVPTVTLNPASGLYEARFTAGTAESLGLSGAVTESTLAFEVAYDGVVFKTLSTKTFFAAGTISAEKSLMVSQDTGVALAVAPATEKGFSTDAPVKFVAVFKDTNNIAKPLTTAELSNVRASVVPSAVPTLALTAEGAVSVSFTAQSAADYAVQVFYNDVAIQGGARAGFAVSAGPAAAEKTFVSVDTVNKMTATDTAAASAVSAGVKNTLYVVAKDAFGNIQDASSARANIVATFTGTGGVVATPPPAVSVKDVSLDGEGVYHVYNVEYSANVAGQYNLDISLGAASLAKLQVVVAPGVFAAAKTVLEPVSDTATVGFPINFNLGAVDLYGNAKASADISFNMVFTKTVGAQVTTVTATGALKTTVTDAFTHTGAVTFTESGKYLLDVTSGGQAVINALEVDIDAGPVVQAKSTITGVDGVEAGAASVLTIVPRDANGNLNLADLPVVAFAPASGDYKAKVTADAAKVTVAYTPPVFGDVTLTASFGASTITATIAVSPSAPPALETVKMASLTGITASFDMDTNMGNMGSSQDCNLVLASATVGKLGTGATCSFTTAKELTITLGSEATILPVGSLAPDTVVIKENAIANAAGNSFNTTGSALLQAPDVTVVPSVVAKAPATVGICEDLTVDASSSDGSGGRNLAFSFAVEGLGSKILSLSNLLKSLDSTQSIADIDKNAMNYGIQYNFIVSATNFLGQTTTEKIPVYRGDTQVPTIFIAGKSSVTTESSSKVTVPCRAEMPGDFVFDSALQTCVKNTGGDLFPVNFSWKSDKSKATFDATGLDSTFAATMETRDFTIPNNYLEAGKTYGFICTGADAADPSRQQSAMVDVTVEYSAYEVSIKGGSRDISASSVLELEAVVADPNEANFPVNYVWDFTTTSDAGYKKSAAFYSTAALSQGKLTLAANELPPGTYVFSVTASKEPVTSKRKAVSASVTITVKEQAVLGVSIESNVAKKVLKPSKTLELFCHDQKTADDDGTGTTTYAWTMTSSVGDADLSSKAQGGVASDALVLPGGSLLPGVDYTFRCAATHATSLATVSGASSKTISTESLPSSGKVIVTALKNGKTFADATIDVASGLGDIEIIAKDWVSNADQIFYEFHAIETTTSTDVLLGTPSAENKVVSSLPVGTYKIVAYIKNDLEPQSALDKAAGAKYEVTKTFKFGDLTQAIDDVSRRRLLTGGAPTNEMEQLYFRFQVGVAEGDVPKALSFALIFGDSFGGAAKAQTCTAGDAAVAQIKNGMFTDLIALDAKVVPTNEYIGSHACAYSGLLYVPGDQQQANIASVALTLKTVLAAVADKSNPLSIPPSEGDPYLCFLNSMSSLTTYIKSDCESKNIGLTMLKDNTDTVGFLAQAVSDTTFAHTVVRKNTDVLDIYASGPTSNAVLNGKFPVTVKSNTTTSSPAMAVVDAEELLKDQYVLSEIISLNADAKSTATFAVPTASLAVPPAGYEPAVKFWTGTFTNGVADFVDVPELAEDGIDAVKEVYGFDLNVDAGETLYVVFYAVEIKLGLSMLEFYAPEYSYTTATGQLTGAIELTPPFSMKNYEYTVSVTNLQPLAEFKAQVAVDGIKLEVSKAGELEGAKDVTASAMAVGVPAKFAAGDIDVHGEDECVPTSACVAKTNVYEFKLTKGDDTKSYFVRISRSASTQGDLQDLKLAAASVYEQLYDDGMAAVSYSDSQLAYSAYVYSSVTAATIEAKAQANAPFPYGPGGAHLVVQGPGATGANAISAWGNSTAVVGSAEPNSANKHILIGKNPVTVDVTSQDGQQVVEYVVKIFRMGKPVSVTERFAGLNANDFINNADAQNAFIAAKAAQLGIEPYQVEILLIKSGSVIVEYVIYPVVDILRDPTATPAEKDAVEAQVTTANILGADNLATTVLSKTGEVLDFGAFGSGVSEIQKSATPPIPRPSDLPCPVCPLGYLTTTETNGEGVTFCSCAMPAEKKGGDDLGDGEIAGIVVGCVLFVAAVAVVSIVIYRRRRQAQQVLDDGGSSDEDEDEGNNNNSEGEAEDRT